MPPDAPPPPHRSAPPAPARRGATKVWIDRRPIVVLVYERFRRQLWSLAVLALFFAALRLPPPPGLSEPGFAVLCLFGLCVTYWVSGLLPLSITSLIAMAGIPLLGVMPADQAYAYFGSPVVFFVLGAFILGAAVVGCGLSTRIAVGVLRRFGRTPRGLIYTVYLLCAVMSCFISEHAVAAMMFPIVVELTRALHLNVGRSEMARALVFALAWGCIAGGTTTILGGARGPLAIGFLEKIDGATIDFLAYVLYGLPLVGVLLGVGAWLLRNSFTLEVTDIEPARRRLEIRLAELGKLSWQEQGVAMVLLGTIIAWATLGHGIGMANVAIVGIAALFILGLSTWREIEANVNWGILLTYGGAICLGAAMAESGTATWIIDHTLSRGALSPQLLLLVVAAIVMVLTEFMSNSAVIAIMMPTALALAPAYDLDPRAVTMAVALPSNFAFMLPAASPPTAMAYSSGTFAPIEAVRRGLVLDLCGLGAMALLIYGYWPLIGLI